MRPPIQSATQAAVETLIAQLENLVASLPAPTIEQLASEQLAVALDIE